MAVIISGNGIEIKFTNRDYSSSIQDFYEIANQLAPDWDLVEADQDVVLVETVTSLGVKVQFYVDRRAEEAFLSTARLRNSAKKIGRLYGYEPTPTSTASVNVTFTVTAAGTIPQYFRVGTDENYDGEPVSYELLTDETVGGAGSYVRTCYHGQTYEEELLGASNATPGQTFLVPRSPIATGINGEPSVQVEVDDGAGTWIPWTYVTTFKDSLPTSQHFKVIQDDENDWYVVFGDGVKGAIPSNSGGVDNIRSTYRIGGGLPGSLPGVQTITSILDAKGSTIVSSVTNLTKPAGGSDEETLEEMQENIPYAIAANDRLVTFDDVTGNIKKQSLGVHQVRTYRGQGPYEWRIVVASAGGNPVPTGYWDDYLQSGAGIIGAVGSYLHDKIAGNVRLDIQPAVKVPVINSVKLYLYNWAYKTKVLKLARAAISDFLNSDNQSLGGSVLFNEYAQLLEEIDGVKYSEIIALYRSPKARFVSGEDVVFITNYSINPDTIRETWEMSFVDQTKYKMVGSVSGQQATYGLVDGSQYYTDKKTLGFRASVSPSIYPTVGTRYIIDTSDYRNSIFVSDDEILSEGTTTIELEGGR